MEVRKEGLDELIGGGEVHSSDTEMQDFLNELAAAGEEENSGITEEKKNIETGDSLSEGEDPVTDLPEVEAEEEPIIGLPEVEAEKEPSVGLPEMNAEEESSEELPETDFDENIFPSLNQSNEEESMPDFSFARDLDFEAREMQQEPSEMEPAVSALDDLDDDLSELEIQARQRRMMMEDTDKDEKVDLDSQILGIDALESLEESMESEISAQEDILPSDSSFVKAKDEPYMVQDMDIMNLLSKDDLTAPTEEGAGLDDESKLAGLMSGLSEESSFAEEKEPDRVLRKSLLQRFLALFAGKEPTEEQRLQEEHDAEEERIYEDKLKQEREVKKQEKQEKSEARKAQLEVKRQEKAAVKEREKAAKVEAAAEKLKKREAKLRKRHQGVPRSQLVSVRPVFKILLIAIPVIALFLLATSVNYYHAKMKSSKEKFVLREYNEAYKDVIGLKINSSDKKYYDQISVIRAIDKEREAYRNYIGMGKYKEALVSLVNGVNVYRENKDKADNLGLSSEIDLIYSEILSGLTDTYQITVEDAQAIYGMSSKKKYKDKIIELAAAAANRQKAASGDQSAKQ